MAYQFKIKHGLIANVRDTDDNIGVSVNQNDVTNNPVAVNISNTGTGDSLQINSTDLVVDDEGNVGVGTGSPIAELEVVGDVLSKGTSWTIRTSAADNNWYSVTYGNGLFVAIANSIGSGNRVMTSPDGINWTTRTSAADNDWYGICYGNGLFVAVANSGIANRVMTSPDGINWTTRTPAVDNLWRSVVYGNGLFVAVSNSGTGNRAMTSPDGITWTERTSAADNGWLNITYGNGLFVAVAETGTNKIMTSPDGITWTSRTSIDDIWHSVCYGNGLFVAVAYAGENGRVMTSPDGITWTERTAAVANSWRSVCYANGLFVAVANSGTGNRVMTSPDGINWGIRTSAADNNWVNVCAGNGLFVAVAYSGTGNRVMTSGKQDEYDLRHDNIHHGETKFTGNIEVEGAMSCGTLTITASSDTTDVSGINTLFIDPAATVVIGGFQGGVNGQHLTIVIIDPTQDITLEHAEGVSSQDIYLHKGTDETLSSTYGGWTLVCNGTSWFDADHAQHV